MNSRTVTTLSALLIAIGLFVYSRVSDKQDSPQKDEAVLYKIPKDKIERLEILEGEKKLELVRQGEKNWEVRSSSGEFFTADEVKVSAVLDFFSEPKGRKVELENPQWSLFGLEPPEKELIIHLSTNPPETHIIHFGKKSPVGWEIYTRLAGDSHLYLIQQYRVTSLNTDPQRYKPPPPPPPPETKPISD